jgi:hypothetical protein
MKDVNKDLIAFLSELAEDKKRQIRELAVKILKNLSIIHKKNLMEDAFNKMKSEIKSPNSPIPFSNNNDRYMRCSPQRSCFKKAE